MIFIPQDCQEYIDIIIFIVTKLHQSIKLILHLRMTNMLNFFTSSEFEWSCEAKEILIVIVFSLFFQLILTLQATPHPAAAMPAEEPPEQQPVPEVKIFVAEPMRDRPVTDISGIGNILGRKLALSGYDKVSLNRLNE